MKVDLIFLYSPIHNVNRLINEREPLFERLRSFLDLEIVLFGDYIKDCKTNSRGNSTKIVFIGSGGTEESFTELVGYLSEPFIIAADSISNSLAASFEICSWLNAKQYSYKRIIFPSVLQQINEPQILSDINSIADTANVKSQLNGYNIGCIGGYSSWLISSHISKEKISSQLGVNFKEIQIDELQNEFTTIKASHINWENNSLYRQYVNKIAGECTPEYLKDALVMYMAVKNIAEKYSLNALTIKCFNLLSSCKTTACIALALLNDQGIVSACEGDLKSLLTMVWIDAKFHKRGFMANPSDINPDKMTMDFAHCTIPFSMIEGYTLPTHFESNIGVGIAGKLSLGEYTIVKLNGTDFTNMLCCHGRIIEAPSYPTRCRTQLRFEFESKEDFVGMINNRMGNHIIIVKGRLSL